MVGERVNDVGADRLAVLHVSFTFCLLIGDALLLSQAGIFCLLCLKALSFHCRSFFAFCPCFRFLLLTCRTLFRFDALALRQLCTCFLFSFATCCSIKFRFMSLFGFALGFLSRFLLQSLVTFTLSLFRYLPSRFSGLITLLALHLA